MLHPSFVCTTPSSTVNGNDHVIAEWRTQWQLQTFLTPWCCQYVVRDAGSGLVDCQATLGRKYGSRDGNGLIRPMVELIATAQLVGAESRGFRVLGHRYEQSSPVKLRGFNAQSQIGQDIWVLQR